MLIDVKFKIYATKMQLNNLNICLSHSPVHFLILCFPWFIHFRLITLFASIISNRQEKQQWAHETQNQKSVPHVYIHKNPSRCNLLKRNWAFLPSILLICTLHRYRLFSNESVVRAVAWSNYNFDINKPIWWTLAYWVQHWFICRHPKRNTNTI